MSSSASVLVGRVYDPPDPAGGARVLVDRLWPRGLSKQAAALDTWCRDIAPSNELRAWYAHDPARFDDFAARYRAELNEPARAAGLASLRERCSHETVTLLTATRALEISHAIVLAAVLSGEAPPE
jgi:uncharacterized protein YeaO (DUF488 family)